MYVENIVNDFYNIVSKEKVLVLANCDIDGICAAKILQWLFRFDNVVYTLKPVHTITDLTAAFNSHKQEIKFVILINCGGTIDLIDLLQPSEDVVFYIADSHRPTDVCNIYTKSQIRLLSKFDESEGIPDFNTIFNDDEDEDEDEEDVDQSDDEDDSEDRVSKRRRLDEEHLMRRRERRLWNENRKRILFEYIQFSYYGRSTAGLMFELSWYLHRENVDLLWWCAVGAVEQFILFKVEFSQYLEEVERMSAHVCRLCPPRTANASDVSNQHSSFTQSNSSVLTTDLRISIEQDLQLALYRHWTVESSLRYSMCTAVALKLWAIKGEKRLQQLLVEMGLPLVESRQQFNSMDLNLRKEFHPMIEKMSCSRNLTHLTYPSFILMHGFRTKYNAADYVYSLMALLSDQSRGKTMSDRFYDAMDALSRDKKDLLDDGIEKAKKIVTCIFRQVQNALDMRQVISAGPFFYFVLQEGMFSKYYANSECLLSLARFVLRAHVASSKKRISAQLPLIASAPLDEQFCLVAGVPPVTETMLRSFFGKAFEQAAEKSGCSVSLGYFDSNVVKMQIVDRPKFFDALTVLLS